MAVLPLKKSPPESIQQEAEWLQSHSGRFKGESNVLPLRESVNDFLGHPTHILVRVF
jgi:hypothetical protein